jgi:hypothetical protein
MQHALTVTAKVSAVSVINPKAALDAPTAPVESFRSLRRAPMLSASAARVHAVGAGLLTACGFSHE